MIRKYFCCYRIKKNKIEKNKIEKNKIEKNKTVYFIAKNDFDLEDINIDNLLTTKEYKNKDKITAIEYMKRY